MSTEKTNSVNIIYGRYRHNKSLISLSCVVLVYVLRNWYNPCLFFALSLVKKSKSKTCITNSSPWVLYSHRTVANFYFIFQSPQHTVECGPKTTTTFPYLTVFFLFFVPSTGLHPGLQKHTLASSNGIGGGGGGGGLQPGSASHGSGSTPLDGNSCPGSPQHNGTAAIITQIPKGGSR